MIVRFTLLILFITLSIGASNHANAAPDSAHKLLRSLNKHGSRVTHLKWNEQTDTPSLVAGSLTQRSRHSPQWICYQYLLRTKKFYGIRNPEQDMKVMKIEKNSADAIRIHLQQLLFDTPVWGASLIVDMDGKGVIHKVEGTVYPGLEKKLFNLPMHAAITPQKAISIAKTAIGTHETAAGGPESSLYYLPTRPGCPLIYAVTFNVGTPRPATRTILVHGLTRRVIGQIP